MPKSKMYHKTTSYFFFAGERYTNQAGLNIESNRPILSPTEMAKWFSKDLWQVVKYYQ